MLIKASAFAVGRDFDRPLGALIQSEGVWFLRAQIKDRQDTLDVAVAISGRSWGRFDIWRALPAASTSLTA